jgi:hypothetical protein
MLEYHLGVGRGWSDLDPVAASGLGEAPARERLLALRGNEC